ncbi:MAG: ABC transporter substrate-binding protein [Microscillaceae bacterium]|nr:ABC transporter substrate-binding protein [Microscillaceae bacterium]
MITIALGMFSCGSNDSTTEDGSEKKIFRYNQTGGLTSLDPAFANKRSNIWATTQLYNGLFSFSKNLDVHPELVKEWEMSEDGKMYTFTIKHDIRFHDNDCFKSGVGREVRADDFIYSFKRILTTGNGAWIFNDKLLLDASGKISDTAFVKVDDYRFRIHLNRRFPAFLQILAMPYCYVLPKEAVDKYGKDFRSNPVGTGPFVLTKWDEKNTLLMAKNKHYWKKDGKGNPLPYLDVIQVSFIEDRNQEFRTFEKKELDFIANLAETSRDEILEKNGEVKEQFANKFNIEKIPYLNTEYIGFLLEGTEQDNPFMNPKLRQALSYAIDRKRLLSFLRNGLGTPGDYGVVPVALPSFDSTRVKGYPHNQRKAQELLKEAGYPGGKGLPALKLYTYSSDGEIAEFLQKEWQAIGVKVDIETNQFAAHQELVDNGKVKFFRGSWLGDYPDAENYLAMFYSKNNAPVGPNKTHFSNPEFDDLFEEAHETDNLFTRYEDYLKMDQIVMENAPIIVLYYDEVLQLKQSNIVGLEADPMNNLRLETVDIKNGEEVASK